MVNELRFCREKADTFSKLGLAENSIVFFESYRKQPAGDCLALLEEICSLDRYRDWTIFWAVPDFVSVTEDFRKRFGSRVRLVKWHSIGFIKAMERARLLVTADTLPSYFVKREGQHLIGLYPSYMYPIEEELRSQRALLYSSVVKSDLVYTDADWIKKGMEKRFGGSAPFRIIEGKMPRHRLKDVENGGILIDLSRETMGATYADLEAKFKKIKTLGVEFGRQVYFRLKHRKWLQYQEENDPRIIPYLISDIDPLSSCLSSCEILVTDQIPVLLESAERDLHCVFLTDRIPDFYSYKGDGQRGSYFVNSLDEAIVHMRKFFEKGPAKMAEEKMSPVKTENCLLWEGIEKDIEESLPRKANKGDILLVLPPSMNHRLWRLLGEVTGKRQVEVLFQNSDQGSLWNTRDYFPLAIPLYCHEEGRISLADGSIIEERDFVHGQTPADEDLFSSGWKGLVGDRRYEKIYFVGQDSGYWKEMLACSPAEERAHINELGLLRLLLYFGRESLANLCEAAGETVISLKQESYFAIGKDGSDKILLRKKGDLAATALVMVNRDTDLSKVRDYLTGGDQDSYFLFDPHKRLEEDELVRRKEVYWIPQKKLPVWLFAKAGTVAFSRDSNLLAIAEICGKKIEGSDRKDRERNVLTAFADLMMAKEADEMVMIPGNGIV